MELAGPLSRVMPELASLSFPTEPLATCAECAMAPRTPARTGDLAFTAPARCCTYHPRLANFLVGRALRRGGPGAEQLRTRIALRAGVCPYGIGPGPEWTARWRARSVASYGRDEALTCPYWRAGEPLGCSIHDDRDAVCRAWHCKVAKGARGQVAWAAASDLMAKLERRLAEWCAARLTMDDPERYYVACADAVDGAADAELAALRSPGLDQRLAILRALTAERDAGLPDVVTPRVSDWVRGEDGVALASCSPYDRTLLPPWIFELLARLDGTRTWRQAAEETADALQRPIPEEIVRWLWDRGLVGPPVPAEGPDGPVLSIFPA
jgi:hypothetical protein